MTAPSTVNRRERKAQRRGEVAVQQAPSNRQVSLVAAAVNVRVANHFANTRWGGTEWQQEGWLHYDTCPEFKAGVNLGAGNLSRARLIGVEVNAATGELGTQPTDDPDVQDVMGQLFGGPTGQSQALAQLKRHLDVAGDAWVLATDAPDLDGAAWEVLATTEVTSNGSGRIMVEQLNGIPREVDTASELLIRVWRGHPKRRWDADAPTRALLPVLRELAALTAMVSATVKSRLASAGILWLPDEITLPQNTPAAPLTSNTQQATSAAGAADAWLDVITEAMTAPIKDPDSASAVVPMVAMVKADYIDKIQHMEFGRDLDATVEPLRQANIKRLAVGMNAPPEYLLGLGDVNHWSAWVITEDYVRGYLAPDLELIADALTRYYLRPALRARGMAAEKYAIGFDLDALVPKQISVDNATAAWEAGLLSELAYMEVLGFSSGQIADNQERARRLITELLQRGNPQTLAEVAQTIAILFPGITIQPLPGPPATPAAISGDTAPTPAAQSTPAGPTATGTAPNPTPPPTAAPAPPGGVG